MRGEGADLRMMSRAQDLHNICAAERKLITI